jgi:phosphoribosyl 1,2-cyclic phosphodiesterase
MNLCSIASGSSGNCIYTGTDNTGILIDAGISAKRIEQGLAEIDRNIKEIKGIFVSHEHSDHIKGIGVLARKHHIPIYGTKGTIDAIRNMSCLGKIDEDLYHVIRADDEVKIDDLVVKPFRISHDAAEPVAYRMECGEKSAAIATDLGFYNQAIVDKLKNLDVLLLESNHDIHMLQAGPYPYYLKRRILGDQGHLCNEKAAELVVELTHDCLKNVILGHLSKENNYPDLALATVQNEVDKTICVEVAPRDCAGKLYNID